MVSCKTSEKVVINTEKHLRVVGTVVLGDEPCGVTINAVDKDQQFVIMPLNLDDKFKIDGMKLRFNYIEVERPKSNKCKSVKAVMLEEVTRLRQ